VAKIANSQAELTQDNRRHGANSVVRLRIKSLRTISIIDNSVKFGDRGTLPKSERVGYENDYSGRRDGFSTVRGLAAVM
jgi:hypothetical protein